MSRHQIERTGGYNEKGFHKTYVARFRQFADKFYVEGFTRMATDFAREPFPIYTTAARVNNWDLAKVEDYDREQIDKGVLMIAGAVKEFSDPRKYPMVAQDSYQRCLEKIIALTNKYLGE